MIALSTALAVTSACSSSGPGGDGDKGAVSGTVPEFTMGITALPSLDVTKGNTTEAGPTQTIVTEPLEYSNLPDGFTPNLAESVETTPTTIVYTLRKDVKFSDGSPLTTDDVVWSLQRLITDTAATKAVLSNIASIAASGDGQVTVTLKQADSATRVYLTNIGHIMSKAFGEQNPEDLGTPAAMPIGTGPYKYTSFTASRAEVERNPNYWGEKPAPDKLAFDIIPDDTQRQLALRSGSIQGGKLVDIGKLSEWKSIPGVNVETSPWLRLNFLSFDVTKAPYDDVHIRKMVAYALDRDGIIKSAYGAAADPATVFTVKEALDNAAPSKDEVDDFLGSVPTYTFDMKKAAEELALSGYADGLDLELTFLNEFPWSRLAALNLQENLAPLGVKVTPTVIAYDKWVSGVYAGTPPAFGAMEASYLAPSATRISANLSGAFNVAKYSDPEVTATIPELYATDQAARWEATKSILTKIAEDAPYVPLMQPQRGFALSDDFAFTQKLDPLIFESGQWIHFLAKAA